MPCRHGVCNFFVGDVVKESEGGRLGEAPFVGSKLAKNLN